MVNLNKSCMILVILCGFFCINVCNASTANFSGIWCSDNNNKNHTFSLTINKVSKIYKGGYSAVALGGDKIDDNEQAFSFKVSDNRSIKTKITTGIDREVGIIQLKLLNKDKLSWAIVKMPEGAFYVPQKTTLHRCKG